MSHNNIGTWLRFYRKAAKLSVNDVIDKFEKEYHIKYTNKAVYGWENGQNQPPADTFLILCKMYNISNIVEAMGYVVSKDNEPIMLTDNEEIIIKQYRSNKKLRPAINKLFDIEE